MRTHGARRAKRYKEEGEREREEMNDVLRSMGIDDFEM